MALSLFTFITVVIFIIGGVSSFILTAITLSKSSNVQAIDIRQILRAYAYIVCGITVVLLAIGTSLVLKSAFGFVAGSQFSFNLEPYYEQTKPMVDSIDGPMTIPNPTYYTTQDDRSVITINGQKYYSPDKIMMQDLINGIILTLTSVFFLVIHILILFRLNYKGLSFLTKLYIFNMLAVFSVTSLIIVPTAIYAVVNYIFFPVSNNVYDYGRLLPGEYLAIAIVSTILWVYYLVRIMRYFSKTKTAS